jgi:hypothetical protein
MPVDTTRRSGPCPRAIAAVARPQRIRRTPALIKKSDVRRDPPRNRGHGPLLHRFYLYVAVWSGTEDDDGLAAC